MTTGCSFRSSDTSAGCDPRTVPGAGLVPVPHPSPTRPQLGVAERTGALDLKVPPPVTDHPRRLRSHIHTLGLRWSSHLLARHVLKVTDRSGDRQHHSGGPYRLSGTGDHRLGSRPTCHAEPTRSKRLWSPKACSRSCTPLEGEGIGVRLDGGWGVDALVGDQTRPHADLDLAVDRDELERIQQNLERLGFLVDPSAERGCPLDW
jgi:Aminoglycoside-2''-adenylyltransferase